jgi:hypothetical protein
MQQHSSSPSPITTDYESWSRLCQPLEVVLKAEFVVVVG